MDPSYAKSVASYCTFLFFACAIASLYCGPSMFAVWALTTVGLLLIGRYFFSGPLPPAPPPRHRPHRRCRKKGK
jgi:hypothetical protein